MADRESENVTVSGIETPTLTNRVIIAIILFTVSLTGILGNCLVIAAVIVSKKLRTTTNVFVTNLAIADLLTSLFLPVLGASLLSTLDRPLPDALCGTAIGIVQICLGCSLYTLASIAINRLWLIATPISFYRRIFNRKVMVAWISLTWIINISITCIPIIFDIGYLGFDKEYHICGGVSDHVHSLVYESIIVIGLYPLPLLVIIVSYIWLFVHIHIHQRHIRRSVEANRPISAISGGTSNTSYTRSNSKENVVTPRIEIEIPSDIGEAVEVEKIVTGIPKKPSDTRNGLPVPNHHDGVSGRHTSEAAKTKRLLPKDVHSKRNYELQITKNLFIVVCAFILCQTPYFTIYLFNVKGAPVLYAALGVFLNSAVNPVIYAAKHPHFRKVFKCILLCKVNEVPERADFIKSIDFFSRSEF